MHPSALIVDQAIRRGEACGLNERHRWGASCHC